MLGRKLGARMGLWIPELTDDAAGLSVPTISCPKKLVGAAGDDVDPGGAARISVSAEGIRGETEHWDLGSGLETTDWKTGLGFITKGDGIRTGICCCWLEMGSWAEN